MIDETEHVKVGEIVRDSVSVPSIGAMLDEHIENMLVEGYSAALLEFEAMGYKFKIEIQSVGE